MKRFIAIALCAVLCTSLLSACGKNKDNSSTETQESTSTPEPSSESTEPTETTHVTEATQAPKDGVAGKTQAEAGKIALEEEVSGTVEGNEYAWFAFTTGDTQGASYQITFTNQTSDSYKLYGLLCNEDGKGNLSAEADSNGTPVTLTADQLQPNTTYYLRFNPASCETIAYTVVVNEISGQDATQSSEDEKTASGSSQTNAVLIPLETKVFGTVLDDSYAWYSFTAGAKQTVYNVTIVDETPSGYEVIAKVYDEFGTDFGTVSADEDGAPYTMSLENLEPGTTYYICFSARDHAEKDFSVIIRDANHQATAHKTADSFSQAIGADVMLKAGAVAGRNVNDALLIPYKTKVSGTLEDESFNWLAFTTGESKDTIYKATLVNNTTSGYELIETVYDELGKQIGSIGAEGDGVPVTLSLEQLAPNTTYYIRLSARDHAEKDYTLTLNSSETPKAEEKPLVFETPFEINETQVQFVINKATFINEQKAKEVLKPVADAILANPDHSILIAGTTATDGTQESCIDLSVKRAEAVRNLLVSAYGVPASQLKVVGLGYANDPFERGNDVDAKGNFVESEAKKNRRVVVLDADDPIAQELLKKAH